MRKNSIAILILATFFLMGRSDAQKTTPHLSGHVLVSDGSRKPAEFASVMLFAASDTTVLKTMVTDANGNFLFAALTPGKYRVEVSITGYKKYSSSAVTVNTVTIALPDIILQPMVTTLQEVSVTNQKPFIEQKIDRTVVNVNSMISNTGANALEVLEKSPGVQVDADGNITFKGKTGVLVMIDDKPTYLSASDLATYLKSLPASALDKIELMENPPAKYDAAGNAGVINIKTKKTKTAGFNGSLSSSFGHSYQNRYNESVNLNYHVNKINVFANASYNRYHGYRRLDVSRDFFDASGNTLKSFQQSAYFDPINKNINVLAGVDYYLSSKTTWGIAVTRTHSISDDHRVVNSNLSNGTGKLDSMIIANNTMHNRFDKKSANLNYSHSFDSTGKTFTFDLDYINYDANAYQGFLNDIFLPNNTLKNSLRTIDTLPSSINIYSAKADYSQPLRNKAKIEAGIKSSYVNTDNAANYFNVSGNINTIDYNNTNHFLYRENINAAYLNFNKEFTRFSLQTGLRLENTNGSGHQLGNAVKPDSTFINSYLSLFPTAYFSYKFDTVNKHSLVFSYGRRISRPNYQDLNPFVSIIDKFTYFSGNPFLRPQYANNYQLAYHYKNFLTVSAIYNHSYDVQIETIDQRGDIFVSHTGNVGTQDYMSLTANINTKPAKWWSFNLYAELDHNHYQGALNGGQLNESSTYFYASLNNQLTLGKGWNAEISGWYMTAATFSQFVKIPTGQLYLGIQKKILHDKGSIRLNVRDVLRTNNSAGEITNIPNIKATFHNTFDSQSVNVGFTYAFGSQPNKEKRKTGGADSETQRAGN